MREITAFPQAPIACFLDTTIPLFEKLKSRPNPNEYGTARGGMVRNEAE